MRLTILQLAAIWLVTAQGEKFVPHQFNGKQPIFVEQFYAPTRHEWAGSDSKKIVVDEKTGEREVTEFKYNGIWRFAQSTVYPALEGDEGLVLTQGGRHYAISTPLHRPILFEGKLPFVLQYEVKLQEGLDCGGAYLKLLRAPTDSPSVIYRPERLDDRTPYTIMFGPDRCGTNDRVHFIFQHLNPVSGKTEEKHLADPPMIKSTKLSTLYTLIVRPDNTFEILINREKVRVGSLLSDFNPPVNPPKEIDDPTDLKPADWVNEAKDENIPPYVEDLEAKRPAGWLEKQAPMIADPHAKKPAHWVDEEDGEWSPPLIVNPACTVGCGPWKAPLKKNPKYHGPWKPPLIDNPAYRGEWKPRKLSNPEYWEDQMPCKFLPAIGIGFELWTIQGGILFDNILITNDEQQAKEFAEVTWMQKYDIERVVLEEELRTKGISDEPSAAEDPTNAWSTAEPTQESFWRRVLQQIGQFWRMANADPLEAIKNYPFLALNSALFTFSLIYLISNAVGVLVSRTVRASRPIAVMASKDERQDKINVVRCIQKSEKLQEDEQMTLQSPTNSEMHSDHEVGSASDSERSSPLRHAHNPPSMLPRPISPSRRIKHS